MTAFRSNDRKIYVPPKQHLLKMQKRLERLQTLGTHEYLRPSEGGESRKLPSKRDRLQYMETFDKLIGENLPQLLEGLLGNDQGST